MAGFRRFLIGFVILPGQNNKSTFEGGAWD